LSVFIPTIHGLSKTGICFLHCFHFHADRLTTTPLHPSMSS
jgi:hypothetical protein